MPTNCICGRPPDRRHNPYDPIRGNADPDGHRFLDFPAACRKLGFLLMDTANELADRLAAADSPAGGIDRRASERTDCHTVVSVVVPGPALKNRQPRIIKARSEDVSVTGARISSVEPLPDTSLYLQFLLPTFGDRFVEAEIVTESFREHITVTGGSKKLYTYGLRFVGIVSNDEIARIMTPAPESTANSSSSAPS